MSYTGKGASGGFGLKTISSAILFINKTRFISSITVYFFVIFFYFLNFFPSSISFFPFFLFFPFIFFLLFLLLFLCSSFFIIFISFTRNKSSLHHCSISLCRNPYFKRCSLPTHSTHVPW